MALLNKVSIKNPKLSNFDLGRKSRTTMAPGLLYPVLIEECLPGDHINLKIDSLVKTYPLLAPLMGSFKFQCDVFFVPSRLYTPELRLNEPNFDPTSVSYPYLTVGDVTSTTAPDWVYESVSNSSLVNYLGVPAKFAYYAPTGTAKPKFNGIPFLGYYDIYRNYYVNTQEEYCYQMGYDLLSGESVRSSIPLDDISTIINKFSDPQNKDIAEVLRDVFPSRLSTNPIDNCYNPLSGLFCKTYLPDLNNTWINTASYDSSVTKARLNVMTQNDDDYITMNQVRTGNKLLKYLERTLVSGGRFGDWIRAQFGVNTNYKLDIPEFLGSNSTHIIFDDVVQTSGQANVTSTELGSLGGRGHGLMRSRGHEFNVTENGYLMVIASLTPLVDYYQGVKPYLMKTMYSDCFSPALDNLGFQTTPYSQLSALPEVKSDFSISDLDDYNPFSMSAGYQPAWSEYMSSVNEVHGEFCNDLNYWTLSRDFTDRSNSDSVLPWSNPCIPTSYVFPEYYNDCFADTDATAQNFMVQFNFDLFMKRPISKQIMPTL